MAKNKVAKNDEDWTDIENVFATIEKLNKRKLRKGDKELIIGQRLINRRFFDTINAILETISPPQKTTPTSAKSGAAKKTAQKKPKSPLEAIKEAFQDLPGERPPGCSKVGGR